MTPTIDLMIIGAQKAGTTSLLRYLGEHPEVDAHAGAEFGYFVDPAAYPGDHDAAFALEFGHRGLNGRTTVAKSASLYTSEVGLRRLRRCQPDTRLVFLLRDPVARARSSYLMEVRRSGRRDPFRRIVDVIESGDTGHWLYRIAARLGIYADHIERIASVFPARQVEYLLFEDLVSAPQELCRRCFEILGVDPTFEPDTDRIHNPGGAPRSSRASAFLWWLSRNRNPLKRVAKRILPHRTFVRGSRWVEELNRRPADRGVVDHDTRKRLRAFFEPHNRRLEGLTGLDVSHWSTG